MGLWEVGLVGHDWRSLFFFPNKNTISSLEHNGHRDGVFFIQDGPKKPVIQLYMELYRTPIDGLK